MRKRFIKPDAISVAMVKRAIESNEDIKAGRTFGYEEALERVKNSIRKK